MCILGYCHAFLLSTAGVDGLFQTIHTQAAAVVLVVLLLVVVVVASAVLVEICRHNTEAWLSISSLIYGTKLETTNNCVQSSRA
jgi:hypothetical protein